MPTLREIVDMVVKRISALTREATSSDLTDGEFLAVDKTDGYTRKMTVANFASWVLGRIRGLSTSITAFRTGDVIPVDGPSGTAKMAKDNLLRETAQNAFGYSKEQDFFATKQSLTSETERAVAKENELENLFVQPTEEAVATWLNDHPEATTTVQDGSLTEQKFSDSLKLLAIKDYVTPEMFGAKGDGETDDAEALRAAINSGKKVLLTKCYYIESSLYTSGTIKLNIEGINSPALGVYEVGDNAGIKFKNGINVFSGATIKGSIKNVIFAPVSRTQSGSIFYNCVVSGLVFEGNCVANILAFCYNTRTENVTRIMKNRFLTCYFFAKCDDDVAKGCTDTIIEGNYINGGVELFDNTCFQFQAWSGSNVTNNFIDFYRSIYECNYSGGTYSQQLPASTGNQYQVFLYLIGHNNTAASVSFTSVNDTFNWTKSGSHAHITGYTKETYIGHDSQVHNVPENIVEARNTWTINMVGANIQSNMGNLVFIYHALGQYENSHCYARFIGVNEYDYDNNVATADAFYDIGTYPCKIDIGFIKKVDSLPAITTGWKNTTYPGMYVCCDKVNYRYEYEMVEGVFSRLWRVTDNF